MTIRETELIAADELEHAARMLRKEEEVPSTKEQALEAIAILTARLVRIVMSAS